MNKQALAALLIAFSMLVAFFQSCNEATAPREHVTVGLLQHLDEATRIDIGNIGAIHNEIIADVMAETGGAAQSTEEFAEAYVAATNRAYSAREIPLRITKEDVRYTLAAFAWLKENDIIDFAHPTLESARKFLNFLVEKGKLDQKAADTYYSALIGIRKTPKSKDLQRTCKIDTGDDVRDGIFISTLVY